MRSSSAPYTRFSPDAIVRPGILHCSVSSASVPRHVRIDVRGPGVDAAHQVGRPPEAETAQVARRGLRAPAMMADDDKEAVARQSGLAAGQAAQRNVDGLR